MAARSVSAGAAAELAQRLADLEAEEACIQMVVGHWPNVANFERGLIEVYGSDQARRIIKALERRKADLVSDLKAVEQKIRGKSRREDRA